VLSSSSYVACFVNALVEEATGFVHGKYHVGVNLVLVNNLLK